MYFRQISFLRHPFIFLLIAVLVIVFSFFTSTSTLAMAQSSLCGKWQAVTSPNPTTQWNQLQAITAISARDVWAVGYSYPSQSSPTQTLTERWDGNKWAIITSPNVGNDGSQLTSVTAISSTDVWAVGASFTYGSDDFSTLIENWNGTTWNIIPSPNPDSNNYLSGVVALAPNNIWAVGTSSNPGSYYQTLIEHWDGTNWTVVNSPNPANGGGLNGVAAISPTNIWAVGSYLIEHWDGTTWSIIPAPVKGLGPIYLFGVTANLTTGEVWTVGRYEKGNYARTLIEYWNGTKWKVISSPNIGPFDNALNGATAITSNNIWAVGYYISQKTGNRLTLIEHWNGTQWSIIHSPNAGKQANQHDDYLNSVSVIPGTTHVWAVGYYISPPPYAYTLTEFYC